MYRLCHLLHTQRYTSVSLIGTLASSLNHHPTQQRDFSIFEIKDTGRRREREALYIRTQMTPRNTQLRLLA